MKAALFFAILLQSLLSFSQGNTVIVIPNPNPLVFPPAPNPLDVHLRNLDVLDHSEDVRLQRQREQRAATIQCQNEVFARYGTINQYRDIQDGNNAVYIIIPGNACQLSTATVANGSIVSVIIQGRQAPVNSPKIINQKVWVGGVEFIFL